MSSLLQHTGRIDRKRGVELLVYLQHQERFFGDETQPAYGAWGEHCKLLTRWVDSEPQRLEWNGKAHIVPKLYRIWRKPVGTWGCWVVFRINGAEEVPDLSIPIGLPKLPRDAVALTDDEASAAWQS